MDQAVFAPIPARDSVAIELASEAIRANADYNLLVRAAADGVGRDAGTELSLDERLEELDTACVALAAVATTTLAGHRAKASVLLFMARTAGAGISEGQDNTGLAFSLLEDILGRDNLASGTTLIDDVLSDGGRAFGLRVC